MKTETENGGVIKYDMKKCAGCGMTKSFDQYYGQSKEKANGDNYIYYPPECKECTKTKNSRWQAENRERSRDLKRKHANTPEGKVATKERSRRAIKSGTRKNWWQKNPNKIKIYNFTYSNKKHDISDEEWNSCRQYFNFRCAYCGMAWEVHKNQYRKDLNREHVDGKGANDLSNCIPSCTPCNSSKHDYSLDEWYIAENPNYATERYDKIMAWLNYDYKKYIQ